MVEVIHIIAITCKNNAAPAYDLIKLVARQRILYYFQFVACETEAIG